MREGVAVLAFDPVTCAALLGRRGKEPNYGTWVIPGGALLPGESHAQAGARELKEESGLEVEVLDYLPSYGLAFPDRRITFYYGRIVRGTLRAGDDLLEVRMVRRASLTDLDLSPAVAPILMRMWPSEPLIEGF